MSKKQESTPMPIERREPDANENPYRRNRRTPPGQLDEALENVIKAWESLPEGRHATAVIQRWLIDDMKPAIDAARAILPIITAREAALQSEIERLQREKQDLFLDKIAARAEGRREGIEEEHARIVTWIRGVENAVDTGGVDQLSENCVRASAATFADFLERDGPGAGIRDLAEKQP